jgi:hypothetical protein
MFTGGTKRGRKAGAALALCAFAALLAATGCSSGGGSSQPSWSSKLGSGVTIVSPGSASPGNDSPDGVMVGVYKSVTSGPIGDLCKYEQPSEQSTCKSDVKEATKAELASALPTFKNFAVGYTAINGTQALIGTTGTVCVPQPKGCYTNNDPAAILDSGKPFATLWKESIAETSSDVYSLSPAIEIHGSWYAYTASG